MAADGTEQLSSRDVQFRPESETRPCTGWWEGTRAASLFDGRGWFLELSCSTRGVRLEEARRRDGDFRLGGNVDYRYEPVRRFFVRRDAPRDYFKSRPNGPGFRGISFGKPPLDVRR